MHQQLSRRCWNKWFRRCSDGVPAIFFECPWEQLGLEDSTLIFQAIHLVVDTKRVVYDARDHPADVGLGGNSPWVCRIIGRSPAPKVGSLFNEATWDCDARG